MIYSFSCESDGCNPRDHLTYDGKSHFYGVTYSGGSNNYGTVFEMSPAGKERVLYRFLGGSDGEILMVDWSSFPFRPRTPRK